MNTDTRNRSLIRVLRLLRDLEGGARGTMEEFAVRYRVCSRTVRRDFNVLQQVGYPICRAPESGDGRVGMWWLDRTALKKHERTNERTNERKARANDAVGSC